MMSIFSYAHELTGAGAGWDAIVLRYPEDDPPEPEQEKEEEEEEAVPGMRNEGECLV
jgi:hypothetical protein